MQKQIPMNLFHAMCRAVKAGRHTRSVIHDAGFNSPDFYAWLNGDKRRKKRWTDAVKWKSMSPDQRADKLNKSAQTLLDDALEHVDPEDQAAKFTPTHLMKMAGAEVANHNNANVSSGHTTTYIQNNVHDESKHLHVERRITRSVVYSPEPVMERFELLDLDELDRSNAERQKAIESRGNTEAKQMQHAAESEVRQRINEIRDKTRDDGTDSDAAED